MVRETVAVCLCWPSSRRGFLPGYHDFPYAHSVATCARPAMIEVLMIMMMMMTMAATMMMLLLLSLLLLLMRGTNRNQIKSSLELAVKSCTSIDSKRGGRGVCLTKRLWLSYSHTKSQSNASVQDKVSRLCILRRERKGSTLPNIRSASDGASISHKSPWSQPFPE